jgi:hypothetical protein
MVFCKPVDLSLRETMPAAASTPACRMPPPSRLRIRRAPATKAADPASIEPTGALRPLDRQNITESKKTVICRTSTPRAVAALKTRAPSRCIASVRSSASVRSPHRFSRGETVPPPRLCVLSTQCSRVFG